MEYTLTFDEKVKGWTSFHSFIPDGISRVNNRLYTIKGGNVWQHNEGSTCNNYYGTQHESSVEVIFNSKSFEDSIYKTIVLESDSPWAVKVSAKDKYSTIKTTEFTKRDSRYFSYIRKNEGDSIEGRASGIGKIANVVGQFVHFNNIEFVNVGDTLRQLNGSTQEIIGTIVNITKTTAEIDSYVTTPVVGRYSYAVRPGRISGAEIRGYVMNTVLTDDSVDQNELFAVSTKTVKSHL